MGLVIHPKRRYLYISTESTPGTYATTATLFAVGNATIPVESLKYTPEVAFQERKPDGSSLQSIQAVPGAQSVKFEFDSRLIGPASKGVAGPLSSLFKALGLSETLVASTSATYVEQPNQLTRLSIGIGMLREDGQLELEFAAAGCGGEAFSLKGDGVGKALMCNWGFLGKQAYASTVPVATDNGTPLEGVTFVDDNTNGFRLIGMTARTGLLARQISKFEFSLGRKSGLGVDISDLSGYDYAHLEDTDPSLKIDPTKVAVATSNDLQNMIQGGMAAAAMTATAPGSGTFQWSTPNLQPIKIGDGKSGNAIATWDIEAKCRRSQTGSAVDASDAWKMVFA